MGLTLVTPAASDPVSLVEAKAQCRIVSSEEDGLIAGFLLAARQHAEIYTRRAFVTQTWDYTLDNDWPQMFDRDARCTRDRIVLPKPPCQAVVGVFYTDLNGDEQTLAADQYRVTRLNQERAEAMIEPAYRVIWPAVRRQSETIRVRFTCGYEPELNPFPETIRQGILLLVRHFDANREAVNVGNIVTEMPLGVEALLFPYRLLY